MSIRKVPIVEGEYYHVYNRGNGKHKIFFDEEDYEHMKKLLFLFNSTKKIDFRKDIVENKINVWDFERGDQLVAIGAWTFMPNHFHIYLTALPKDSLSGKEDEAENNITIFMRKFCTAYSKYINGKYKRTGSLFEGKFKSVHIGNEIHAKYLFSYIHLNILKLIDKNWKKAGLKNKKQAVEFLKSYKYSSFQDYLGVKRPENAILNREAFLDYFSTKEKFLKEIFDWLNIEGIEILPKTRFFKNKN